ncbi:hypothetical protein FDE77_15565 [Clostridium botulinum]|nr:hypothetical protein [Clostridium botulinum]
MCDYPVREVTIMKIYTANVLVRANSKKEAESKAYNLAVQGKLEDKFIDGFYYDIEQYEAYQEGIINEEVIIKE